MSVSPPDTASKLELTCYIHSLAVAEDGVQACL